MEPGLYEQDATASKQITDEYMVRKSMHNLKELHMEGVVEGGVCEWKRGERYALSTLSKGHPRVPPIAHTSRLEHCVYVS